MVSKLIRKFEEDIMIVKSLRSDKIYEKIAKAPLEKKDDIYRYELMAPFKGKWDCYHIPLKATKPQGYDIIMASEMLGIKVPQKITLETQKDIEQLKNNKVWEQCEVAVKNALALFEKAGINLRIQEYLFTLLLANPNSPYISQSQGYLGDGGIPGYITATLVPSEYTISRLPAALAHETNHNVRWQFLTWSNDITLGEMIVSEGLAENFATMIYGEEMVGPWVSKTDMNLLNDSIKPLIMSALDVKGLENINAYLYGDEFARLQNYPEVGMPYCAGYACGYHLIRYFLKKTGVSIEQATLMETEEILKMSEGFWEERTKWHVNG